MEFGSILHADPNTTDVSSFSQVAGQLISVTDINHVKSFLLRQPLPRIQRQRSTPLLYAFVAKHVPYPCVHASHSLVCTWCDDQYAYDPMHFGSLGPSIYVDLLTHLLYSPLCAFSLCPTTFTDSCVVHFIAYLLQCFYFCAKLHVYYCQPICRPSML